MPLPICKMPLQWDQKAPRKLPSRGSNQQYLFYLTMMPMNHENDQTSTINLQTKWWHTCLGGNQQLSYFRPVQQEENHVWYWKLLTASKVMDLGEESTTTTLLNQGNPYLQSKRLSLYPQINVVLVSHQGNFFLQQRPLQSTSNQNAQSQSPVPVDTFTKQFCI